MQDTQFVRTKTQVFYPTRLHLFLFRKKKEKLVAYQHAFAG